MKRIIGVVCLSLIGLAVAQTASAKRVVPYWAEYPSTQQMHDYIPTDPQLGTSKVDLVCTIVDDNGHVGCDVKWENHPEQHYGHSIARVVTQFARLDLDKMPGAKVGDWVAIRTTITFE
ncbi:MAG TPA: hypothetical protein VG839_05935 [Asticcacaulis sp.]|nr:hypothetical protein [Asticcacaulis sp.]